MTHPIVAQRLGSNASCPRAGRFGNFALAEKESQMGLTNKQYFLILAAI
jgi:hypothetical protein